MKTVPFLLAASLAATIAIGWSAAVPAQATAGRDAHGPGKVVPLADILAAVRRIVAGKVIDLELEADVEDDVPAPANRRWVYEIELLTDDDRLVELEFDATTGELLEIEGAPWPADVPRPAK